MEEWQEAGSHMSEHQRVLTAARCGVVRERKRRGRAHTQQTRSRGGPRMYINRRCAAVKSGIRQFHVRQHQDQHNKKQQGHQNEQTRPIYRPASHGAQV